MPNDETCKDQFAPPPTPASQIKYWELAPCDSENGKNYIRDCVDDTCCKEIWISDGYCDGEDQSWGCNLLCYPGENNDCGLFIVDCLGVVNGPNFEDDCGQCDDNPRNDCVQDCAGTWGGSAENDCAGECEGPNTLDECNACDADPSNDCEIGRASRRERGEI